MICTALESCDNSTKKELAHWQKQRCYPDIGTLGGIIYGRKNGVIEKGYWEWNSTQNLNDKTSYFDKWSSDM